MTRLEFLLLDYPVVTYVPLVWLFWENLSMLMNKARLDTPPDEIRAAVLVLSKRGLVQAFDVRDEPCQLTPALIDAAFDSLRDASKETVVQNFAYGLTAEGGKEWEKIANPDWKRFATCSSDPDTLEKEVGAGSRAALDEVIRYDRYFSGEVPRVDTIDVEELSPWEATYWKVAPSGFEATYKFEQVERDRNPPDDAMVWFLSKNNWYTNPWKRPPCEPPRR